MASQSPFVSSLSSIGSGIGNTLSSAGNVLGNSVNSFGNIVGGGTASIANGIFGGNTALTAAPISAAPRMGITVPSLPSNSPLLSSAYPVSSRLQNLIMRDRWDEIEQEQVDQAIRQAEGQFNAQFAGATPYPEQQRQQQYANGDYGDAYDDFDQNQGTDFEDDEGDENDQVDINNDDYDDDDYNNDIYSSEQQQQRQQERGGFDSFSSRTERQQNNYDNSAIAIDPSTGSWVRATQRDFVTRDGSSGSVRVVRGDFPDRDQNGRIDADPGEALALVAAASAATQAKAGGASTESVAQSAKDAAKVAWASARSDEDLRQSTTLSALADAAEFAGDTARTVSLREMAGRAAVKSAIWDRYAASTYMMRHPPTGESSTHITRLPGAVFPRLLRSASNPGNVYGPKGNVRTINTPALLALEKAHAAYTLALPYWEKFVVWRYTLGSKALNRYLVARQQVDSMRKERIFAATNRGSRRRGSVGSGIVSIQEGGDGSLDPNFRPWMEGIARYSSDALSGLYGSRGIPVQDGIMPVPSAAALVSSALPRFEVAIPAEPHHRALLVLHSRDDEQGRLSRGNALRDLAQKVVEGAELALSVIAWALATFSLWDRERHGQPQLPSFVAPLAPLFGNPVLFMRLTPALRASVAHLLLVYYASALEGIILDAPAVEQEVIVYKSSERYPSLPTPADFNSGTSASHYLPQAPFNSTSSDPRLDYGMFLPRVRSEDTGSPSNGAFFVISLQPGTQCLALNPVISAYAYEQEVLLPFGARFVALDVNETVVTTYGPNSFPGKKDVVQRIPWEIGTVYSKPDPQGSAQAVPVTRYAVIAETPPFTTAATAYQSATTANRPRTSLAAITATASAESLDQGIRALTFSEQQNMLASQTRQLVASQQRLDQIVQSIPSNTAPLSATYTNPVEVSYSTPALSAQSSFAAPRSFNPAAVSSTNPPTFLQSLYSTPSAVSTGVSNTIQGLGRFANGTANSVGSVFSAAGL